MKDRIAKLQNIIKINFTNIKLLEKSLIHKSFDNKINNEKLEFLGDRVLGLVISKILIETYPDEKEGIIDKKFANLVNKNTCAIIAEKIKLKNYMILGDTYKIVKKSYQKITSDGLEALIGAIYLDKGLKVSEKFISNYWKEYLDKSEFTLIDAKTKLQEFSLKKYKELPKYKHFKKTGPHHDPVFKVEVNIKNSKVLTGSGSSKKSAEQNAANKLLQDLKL
jgi:ribonuclease-3